MLVHPEAVSRILAQRTERCMHASNLDETGRSAAGVRVGVRGPEQVPIL